MNVYDTIYEIAKQKGFSIKELAQRAGIGENSIYRWRTSKPSMTSLSKVANALNVDSNDLLDNSNDNETPQFRAIQRKAKKLNPEDQELLLKILDRTFKEEFGDTSDK